MKMKNNKRRKGFTLIELIVVIAILAILAAVAVPNFIGLTKKAQTATEVAAASEYANAINIYNTMNPDSAITAIPTAATIDAFQTSLGDLEPVTDFTDAEIVSNVTARIIFTGADNKVAMVDPDNKGDI